MDAIVAGQQFQERMEKVTLPTATSSMRGLKSAHRVFIKVTSDLRKIYFRGGMMAEGTLYYI